MLSRPVRSNEARGPARAALARSDSHCGRTRGWHALRTSTIAIGLAVACLACGTQPRHAHGQTALDSTFPPLPSDVQQITPDYTPYPADLGDSPLPLPMAQEIESGVAQGTEALTREAVERIALGNHPAVQAAVEAALAARGDWLQSGLKPNPTVGYVGNEIGNEGAAGQQGAFASQTFIRGNKLGLNRAVNSHRVSQSEQAVLAQQMLVVRQARLAYFDVLVEQERLKILDDLIRLLRKSEETAQRLNDAKESPRTDLLQARIQTDRFGLRRKTTQVNLDKARRVLAASLGLDALPTRNVVGDITAINSSLVYAAIVAEVEATHPDVAIALAKVDEARCQLARERAEVIPNLSTQVAVQYDDATGDTVTSVQTGVELKLWNRNQGAIIAAQRRLRNAEENVRRVRLELRAKLSQRFAVYDAAKTNVKQYETAILPKAGETHQLISQAYRNGEAGILNVLTAQQTYFEASLGYLDTVKDYWNGWTEVQGLLPPRL